MKYVKLFDEIKMSDNKPRFIVIIVIEEEVLSNFLRLFLNCQSTAWIMVTEIYRNVLESNSDGVKYWHWIAYDKMK